jgi:hypothetical protein
MCGRQIGSTSVDSKIVVIASFVTSSFQLTSHKKSVYKH